jgi:hypothetical protein
MKRILGACLTIIALCASAGVSRAELSREEMRRVGFNQHIGEQISPNLRFREASNRQVTLGEL